MVELTIRTIIKRAISVYCRPNTSQVLYEPLDVDLLHNRHTEVGVKCPFDYYQVYNLFLTVGGRKR